MTHPGTEGLAAEAVAELVKRLREGLVHTSRVEHEGFSEIFFDVDNPAEVMRVAASTIDALVAERDAEARAATAMSSDVFGLSSENESLQARINQLEEALKPFATIADAYSDQEDDEFQVWQDFDVLGASLPLRIFRRARTALEGATHG